MAEDGSEGEVHLDRSGRVMRVARWPWGPAPDSGGAVEALFHPDWAPVVRWCVDQGWACLSEQVLLLASGAAVRAWAEGSEEGLRLVLRDVSGAVAVERCGERRRRDDALAQLAGALARELSNPISVVLFRLELMLELPKRAPDALVEDLRVAFEHTQAATALLRNLRAVGRFPAPSSAPTSLREALEASRGQLGPHGAFVEISLDREDLTVGCEVEVVSSVFAILLRRALDLFGLATVALSARALPRGWVAVDLGPPVGRFDPARVIEDCSLAVTLLDAIGGSLRAIPTPAGPKVQVSLPQPVGRPQKPRTVFETLLVVGARIRPHVQEMLAHDGFAFLVVSTAEEALAQAGRCTGAVVEVVLDGPVSGRHLAAALGRRGTLRVALVADEELPDAAIPPGVVGLRWPTSRDDLLVALGRPRR